MGIKAYISDFSEILRGQRVGLTKLFVMFFSVSLLDLVGIGLVGGYISFLTQPQLDESSVSSVIKYLEADSIERSSLVSILGLILLGLFFVKTLAGIYVNRQILVFCNDQVVRLRILIVKAFQSMSYEDFAKRSSAEYIQRSQNYINQANNSLILLLRSISEGIVLVVILTYLASVNFLALTGLSLIGITIFFLYDRLFRSKLLSKGREGNLASELMVQSIQEGFSGLKEVRILGVENFFLERIISGSKVVARINSFVGTVALAPRYIIELVVVVFVVVLVLVIYVQSGTVESSYPLIGMFGVAALRLAPAMTMTISHTSILRNQRHAVGIVANDLRQIRQHGDQEGSSSDLDNPEGFDNLLLEDVFYMYEGTARPALDGISLRVKSGECIGLIGESGSGKTTLVDLILGLLSPQKGSISVNGRPLAPQLKAWQSKVAYLPQEVFLIDGSIENNVALGIEAAAQNEKLVARAIQQARLTELVEDLPNGLATQIGERGVRLSGGQRQRVALARAFYHRREVLVLDEATSALDHETEREIVKEIQELKGEKTIIVIAHRLSTLQHCDRVLQLGKGRITKEGSYEEMVNLD